MRETTGKNFVEKKFRSNDFEYIPIDSVCCADFKYEGEWRLFRRKSIEILVKNGKNQVLKIKCLQFG